MVQSSFHVPATTEIDLDKVRALLQEHIQPEDQQEGFELILNALLEIQEIYGWVSKDSAEVVAEHLHVPFARVFELLTFYGDFKLEPPGRHRIQLCNGTACFAMGSTYVQQRIEQSLGIQAGEKTPDNEISFDLVPTCLGMCDLGPLGLFNARYYPNLTPETVEHAIHDAVHNRPAGEGH